MANMSSRGRVLSAIVAAALTIAMIPAVASPAQAGKKNSHRLEDPARQANLTLPMKPRDRGTYVHLLQQRLEWLGYDISWRERVEGTLGSSTTAAVRAVQDKFYLPENGTVDKRTWSTIKRVAGDVDALPRVCRSEAKVLCIDKTAKVIRYIKDGKVDRTVHVRFGVPGLETPTGTYRVWFRWRDATSGINGPDVPRAPMPYALFFNGDIAVHYSPTFASSGYYPGGGSHGCVNVADLQDSIYLFNEIQLRGLVHVYW
jgi:lipoprotein-anchoring transpeptidase ErfK/SrfK